MTSAKSMIRPLLVALVLTSSGSAYASSITHLSERDWLSAGDGLLTFDSTRNLEWLDLSVSAGTSILDVEASPIFDGNGGDFRWATETEINHFLMHSGLTLGLAWSLDPAAIAEATQFIQLIGGTAFEPGRRLAAQGKSRAAPSSTAGLYGGGWVEIVNPQGARALDPLVNCCYGETSSNAETGAWLVRSAAPSPAPEPSTTALVGLGIAALVGRRRRGRSRR